MEPFNRFGIFLLLSLVAFSGVCSAQDSGVREKQDFSFALGLYQDGDFKLSYDQFVEFRKTYPSSQLAADALFYSGDCLLQQGGLTDAALAFREFRERYPLHAFTDDAALREGDVYFRQRRFAEAFEQYIGVLSDYPDGDCAHEAAYWAGEASLQRGDYRTAEKYYRISYEHYPEGRIRDYALFSIGYALEKREQFTDAVLTYRALREEFPQSSLLPASATRIAACYYRQGDYGGMLAFLDSLGDSPDPDNAAERLYFRGEGCTMLGKFDAAGRCYADFIAAYPAHARIRQVKYALGWSLLEQKRYSEALGVFDELRGGGDGIAQASEYRYGYALRLLGNVSAARAVLLGILQKGDSGTYACNAHFDLGMLALQDGDLSVALQHFTAAANLSGCDVAADAAAMAGETLLRLKRPADAAAAFLGVLAATPAPTAEQRANALLRRGYAQSCAGQHDSATATLGTFLRSFPHDDRAQNALLLQGEALFGAGRYEDAELSYRQALAVATEDSLRHDAMYGVAWCAYRQERYRDAADGFRSLVAAFPNGAHAVEATIRLGDAQYALKQFSEAAKQYRSIARSHPAHPLTPYALLQLGNAEHRSGDTPSGITTLRGALARYPHSEYADRMQYSIAWMHFQSKDYTVAASEFRKLVELYPASPLAPHALYSIGDCHYNRGAFAEAEQAYRTILTDYADSPLVPDALDGAAQALRMQGKTEAAEHVREEWAAAHPTSAAADDVAFAAIRRQYQQKEYKQAADAIGRFSTAFPGSPLLADALLLRGDIRRDQGDNPGARRAWEELIEGFPAAPQAIDASLRLAALHVAEQDPAQAVERLSALLARSDAAARRAEILYLRGLAQRNARDTDGAREDFASAEQAGGGGDFAVLARIERARILAADGEADTARAILASIAQTRSDDAGAAAQYYLGSILYDKGLHADAEKALLRVEHAYPDASAWAPKAVLLLGRLYETMRQPDKARAAYRKCASTYRGAPESEEAQRRLEGMR